MNIIRKRERIEVISFHLGFDYIGKTGHGFSFDCNENGVVDISKLPPAALRNYIECIESRNGTERKPICRSEHSYIEPAIGECNACAKEVVLSGFTNTCECGIDYNMSGQQLADRSQWGEETGESLADIIGPGSGSDWDYDCP